MSPFHPNSMRFMAKLHVQGPSLGTRRRLCCAADKEVSKRRPDLASLSSAITLSCRFCFCFVTDGNTERFAKLGDGPNGGECSVLLVIM